MPIIKVDNASLQISTLQFTRFTGYSIVDVPRCFWH